jgi:hypothetical protein
MKWISFFLLFLLLVPALYAVEEAGSILVVHQSNERKLQKKDPGSAVASAPSGSYEQIEYRGYTINLQSSGQDYNMQIFTMVHYGNMEVNSIYATQFQTAVEYAYTYDPQKHEIRQDHFLFPPNSLTGWANPEDYVTMRQFDWKERFPSGCNGSVYTSEEFGREYLETSCFHDHDAALKFAKKFINYSLGRRGL